MVLRDRELEGGGHLGLNGYTLPKSSAERKYRKLNFWWVFIGKPAGGGVGGLGVGMGSRGVGVGGGRLWTPKIDMATQPFLYL